MSLPSTNSLALNILALPTTIIPLTGVGNLISVLSSFTNQVQAGPTGSPGIFTFNGPITIPLIVAMPPVADNSWIPVFAAAMIAGITAGTITPGTVTNPAWLGSVVDVNTSPSAVATISTIAVAQATLISKLASATANNNPPYPFAEAIRDAILEFIFICIGLGPGPAFTPIPIPIPAQ